MRRLVKGIVSDLHIAIRLVVMLALSIWFVVGVKKAEPIIFPVVDGFEITQVDHKRTKTLIAGVLNKHRDCEFIEVVAISHNAIVSIEFQETAYNSTGVVSRPVGEYDWGWWAVMPKVSELTLYSRHECWTGSVLTKLYEGKL